MVQKVRRNQHDGRVISRAILLTVPVAIVGGWVLLRADLLGAESIIPIVSSVVLSCIANYSSAVWLARDLDDPVRQHVRCFAASFGTAMVLYSVGWGPMLAVAYLFGTSELLRRTGSTITYKAMAWTTAAIGAGEFAVQFDLVPSTVSKGSSHALAVACAMITLAVTRLFGNTTAVVEQVERELQVKARHYESLVEHSTDLIGVIDEHGVVVSINPVVEDLLGFSRQRLLGTSLWEFVDTQPQESVERLIDGLYRANRFEDTPVELDLVFRHVDGTERRVIATLTTPSLDWNGRTIINVHDVTPQYELEMKLRHEASHDPLTGLLNRTAFAERIREVCEESERHGRTVGMLYIDLDGFKQVNDRFGHDVGDRVLVETARRLTEAILPGEYIARLGGDEFAIVLSAPSDTRAVTLADRLLATVTEPIFGLPPAACVDASIGIATCQALEAELALLLSDADQAMYEAKRRGKARYVLADVRDSTMTESRAT